MRMRDIQQQLAARGYTPGPIDGAWGRQTQAAVRQFQHHNGLVVDGVLGPLTLAALFQGASPPSSTGAGADLNDPTLVWFQEARRLLGTRETAGSGSNPVILDWASDLGLKKSYGTDETPWCGLFVGHCINATLDREPTPSGLLAARSWGRFGIPAEPHPGAVMVFWRKSPQSGLGHVGFYAGEDDEAYRILGGNQSDSVSLAWVAKSRFVAARWPSTVPPRPARLIRVARSDTLSWNEA